MKTVWMLVSTNITQGATLPFLNTEDMRFVAFPDDASVFDSAGAAMQAYAYMLFRQAETDPYDMFDVPVVPTAFVVQGDPTNAGVRPNPTAVRVW